MTTLVIWLLGLFYIGTCIWLVLVVLMQEGKSGGMAGMESASQAPGALTDTFGAGGANKTLFKITAWSAGIFFCLAVALTIFGTNLDRRGGHLGLDAEPAVPVATEQLGTAPELPVAAEDPPALPPEPPTQ